jgi:dihydrofolate synthase/folylpolyglutamate synthase
MAREPISTSDQAVAFLMSLVRDDPRPYQARAGRAQMPVRVLLARLGDPHVNLPVVHIAGSKGKGSTALYLEGILNAAGLRTGTFTSPHLQRWTERYRVDGLESNRHLHLTTPAALDRALSRRRTGVDRA